MRISRLAFFLLITPWSAPSGTLPDYQSQSTGPHRSKEDEILVLTQTIRNKELRKTSPETVIDAIERVGVHKNTDVIADLIELLTFQRKFPWEKGDVNESVVNEIRLITPAGRYPAVGALIQIGKPALDPLVKVIVSNDTRSLQSKNATHAIAMIFRDNPSDGIAFLRAASEKAESTEAAKRLNQALSQTKAILRIN